MKVLVVDDDLELLRLIAFALRQAGYMVIEAQDGPSGAAAFERERPDLVVLDVNMPRLNGFEVLKRIRAASTATPVMMLTVRSAEEDQVQGLDLGADDYLAKPFAMAELLARIRALRRRQVPDRGPALRVADLEIEPATRAVTRSGKPVLLTSREFALLEFLARNAGQVFTRDRLIDAVWNADFAPESNVVEVYIRSLRRKIDGGRRDGMIETVRGAGYRLRSGSAET